MKARAAAGPLVLSVLLALMIGTAFAAAAGPEITGVGFAVERFYAGRDTEIGLFFETTGLESGKPYDVIVEFTPESGGGEEDLIRAQTEFVPHAGEPDGISFRADTLPLADRKVQASVTVYEDGRPLCSATSTGSVEVAVPKMREQTTQGLMEDDLVVSMIVYARNLEPDCEYILTGYFCEEGEAAPFSLDGTQFVAQAPISLSRDSYIRGLETSAELLIAVPEQAAREVPLTPVAKISRDGVDLAELTGNAVVLGQNVMGTAPPAPSEGTAPSYAPAAASEAAISTVAPLEPAQEDVTPEPEEMVQEEPVETALESEKGASFPWSWVVTGGAVGIALLIVWLVYRRMQKNSRAD